METCETIERIRQVVAEARKAGRSIGVVPTMGALHAAHASLIDAAVRDGHFVVVSIFVNPTQFGPNEDLAQYPRTPDADLALCRLHSADAVFMPSVEEMYPRKGLTTVSVAELTGVLCGRSRPGHFAGVCTVVAKLFNIVQPDAAYFGRKDAQQAVVIARMIEDLDMPVRMVVCPIVREPDGLAMSSRNRRLTVQDRKQAAQLYAALQLGAERIRQAIAKGGRADPREAIQAMRDHLARHAPLGQADYVEIVDPQTLQSVQEVRGGVLLALAVRFASARLIDNLLVEPYPAKS
jgi:pantoate--beta-alanine ligase